MVEELGGSGGVLPGYTHPAIPGPIFNIYLRLSPTHGRMKAYLRLMMRFPRKGPRMGPIWPQNDLRMTLRINPPDRSPDALRSLIS